MGDWQMRRAIVEKASKSQKKQGWLKHLARGYNLITVIYGRKGEFVKSTKFALDALRANEKLDDKRGIIASYLKLSAISVELKKFEQAIVYANVADSINNATIKMADLEIGIINNKAIAYAEMKRLNESLAMFNKIYQIAIDNPEIDDFHKPSALLNIGMVYKNKKDYHQAMSYFKKSLEESLKYNVPGIELKSIQNMAAIYHDFGDYGKSNENAFLALKKSRLLKIADAEMEQLELIAKNYTKQKDYKNGLKYTVEYYEKYNLYNKRKNEKEIKELESTYRLQKAEEQLKVANEIKNTRTRQRDLSILFLVIVFGFMVVFAWSYYKIRQLNKQNVETKKQLAESNKVKDKLFSIIGHDLRNAYSGTLSFLHLIKENQLDEDEVQLWIDKVINQSHSSIETLDNLLMWGYTQIKAGNQLNVTNFNSSILVNRNIEFLGESIRNKGISVKNLIPEDLMLTADENHFLFITRNLISNAIKFTPDHGEIVIGYINNGIYEFYVRDNGVGISKDRISEMFTGLGKSTYGTKQEKGTGLGLLLCKEFVELNGGTICVESEQQKGTTFYFTLGKVERLRYKA